MKEKTSPLSKLLALVGIKPKPVFKPYDRVIPHPWLPDETLTIHYERPTVGTFVDPESLFGERSGAAYRAFLNKPASPGNG